MFLKKSYFANVGRGLIISTIFFLSTSNHASNFETQRAKYLAAIEAIENDDLEKFQALKQSLTSYPLYPYLEYRDILRKLEQMSYEQVVAFERKYADLPFSDDIRRKYLAFLAKNKKWKELTFYQKKVPFSKTNQCHFYYAHSQEGNSNLALEGARKLYLSGNSISNACDKLFTYMDKKNQLTDELILERMLLVFERGNRKLLKYLSKQLSSSNRKQASQVLAFYYEPKKIINIKSLKGKTTYQYKLYQRTFKRLARFNPEVAIQHFDAMAKILKFDQQKMAEYIIHRNMSTTDPVMQKWRDKWLMSSKNLKLLERRFRIALVANDWQDKARWINAIPKEQQSKAKWQYWQARLLLKDNKTQEAQQILRSMLGKRNFYSVAAAMQLNENINIPFSTAKPTFERLKPFQKMLARISELEAINKARESKSEWLNILRKADREQKAILAAFASERNWYAHSVQATISGKLWGYLEYRFPVAHRWFFEHFSRENDLPITTLLALSRQESAFYSAAISPVGARGLMQLMPATAKETSSKLGLDYSGVHTLSDPSTNIEIGSGYLRMLLDEFEQNRILAFAAYNAGSHRVNRWLKKSQGNLDVISFIEGIPFYETRGYVQNVLMYEVYYRKLLGMPLEFLYEKELAYNY